MSNYPLGKNEADSITSKTGKKLSQITLEEVKKGNVQADDIKISQEMLHRQGQVAKEADNPAMEANFQRAAELVNVPDDVTSAIHVFVASYALISVARHLA